MEGINSNIDELITKFQSLGNDDSIDFGEALLAGVNAAKAQMQFRIFNKGLDASNVPFGQYKRYGKAKLSKIKKPFKFASFDLVSPYELKRVKKGRQIIYKDLEFTGDLRRGLKTLQENNKKVVCAITNDNLFMIAQGQEKQLHTTIFDLTPDELETLRTNTNAILKQLYDRAIDSSTTI